MADKSFGVKQLDVLGTGTPTISSPNILNLDCHTVAISTSVTIGENLTVSGNVDLGNASSDTISLTGVVDTNIIPSADSSKDIGSNSVRFANGYFDTVYGSGANLTNLPTIAGIWTVTNNSASNYVISGPGGLSSANNPDLYLERGKTYQFAMNASGHGFGIQTSSGTWNQSNEYTTGITNPRSDTGTITFAVPYNAPARLYYACTSSHSGMVGNLYIQGETNQTYFAYDSQGHLAKQDNYDTNGGKSYWYDASATNGGTNQAYIDGQSGDIMAKGNFVVGTAGKGIDFSAQTATSASGATTTGEILVHYEEGTWTATLYGNSSPTNVDRTTSTKNVSVTGTYRRIGSLVYVQALWTDLHNSSSPNDMRNYQLQRIEGLPFPSSNASGTSIFTSSLGYNRGIYARYNNAIINESVFYFYLSTNSTTVYPSASQVRQNVPGTLFHVVSNSTSNMYYAFQMTYHTN